jgi:hypothetical protein
MVIFERNKDKNLLSIESFLLTKIVAQSINCLIHIKYNLNYHYCHD